jgi:hypothetical protein
LKIITRLRFSVRLFCKNYLYLRFDLLLTISERDYFNDFLNYRQPTPMNKNTFPCTSRCTIFLLMLLFISFFYSCESNPEEILKSKIKKGLREDNTIDENEWNDIATHISDHKENFTQLYSDSDNNISNDKLENYILDIASKRREKTTPLIEKPKKSNPTEKDDLNINVYIENSASMDGYIKNTTQFEAAIANLSIKMQYEYKVDSINLNFINKKIYPSKVKKIEDFIDALEPDKKPYKIGERGTSKLNEVLKLVLENTKENEISIFVSDCIYSLSEKGDTRGALGFEKTLTEGAFIKKYEEFNFSTLIIKLSSSFDGFYYDYNDKDTELKKKRRPYYIWVIGSDLHISDILDRINIKQLDGYDNFYFASNANNNEVRFFTVLRETDKIGTFKQTDRTSRDIRDIEEVKYRDNRFQFSIAVDLSDLEKYINELTNTESYTITDGFVINEVKEIAQNNIHPRDFTYINRTSATHIFTIELLPDNNIQDLKLSLKKELPKWVSQSSSSDDRDIISQLDKTFGLNYIMEGVEQAYSTLNNNQETYFTIEIKIKK